MVAVNQDQNVPTETLKNKIFKLKKKQNLAFRCSFSVFMDWELNEKFSRKAGILQLNENPKKFLVLSWSIFYMTHDVLIHLWKWRSNAHLGISGLSRASDFLGSTKVTTALEDAILEAESCEIVLLNATSFIGGRL